jgi:hypothetical protein
MYDKTQFEGLMAELYETNQLLQPNKDNVRRMVKFYTIAPDEAIRTHLNNMIQSFGEKAVIDVIREKIENGEFCEKDVDKVSGET